VLANQTVQEVADQAGQPSLARAFLERLVARLADSFADAASRFVRRTDFFARLRWAEAAGLASAEAEFALTILEPMVVMRELGAAAADLVARASSDSPRAHAPPRGPIDVLPTAVHERVGASATLRLGAGLDGLPIVGRVLDGLPGAHIEQSLFLSFGTMALAAGRRGLHWTSEYALAFEGASAPARLAGALRLAKGDGLELVRVRVESLAGPRILISEVMPAPAGEDSDYEFIELYNPGLAAEDLTGWRLVDQGGRTFRLPDGTRIGAGGTVLLSRSALPFFERYGAVPDVPTLTLALNDGGDRVALLNARGWRSDHVAWGAAVGAAPVPEGASLLRRAADAPPFDMPGSALRFTGGLGDFAAGPPSPGGVP
jgi:hypothetical protein